MAEKIEKKLSRVMRWLERCTLSCRGKSYGSALMDIECARVDFDSAREEILDTLHKQYNSESRKFCFTKLFSTIAASAVILLSIAAPLSFTESTFSAIVTGSSLEWVNSDEKALLVNLRKQLSNANIGWSSDFTDQSDLTFSATPPSDIKSEQEGKFSGKPELVLAENKFVNTRALTNGRANIKNETRIFTLLKIGENALKNKPSEVIVER